MNRSNIEAGLKIDSICDDFEEAWDANSIVDFEPYLQQIDAIHRDKLLAQLIDVDLAMRFNANLTISMEDYSKFGNLAAERVQDFLDRKPLNKTGESHPRKIGRYQLEKKIGEGGMGTVFLAQQTEPVKRQVALKLIRAPLASAEIIQRFDAERQALAMMNHPNIAKVLDAGTSEEDMPYFVMEYVEGQNITDYCDSHRIGIRQRLDLFVQVCQAIQHAHTKGIIHRDIKPNNVLISQSGKDPVVKVIDFGLAKAVDHTQKLSDKTMRTELGRVIGTVQYMSPEQADLEDRDIDTRTDIYSLGVLLYELLTGSTPLDHQSLNDLALLKILDQIREKEPPRPSVRLSASGDTIVEVGECRSITPYKLQEILRGELDWIVMKALDKERNRRYATADGLCDDVLRFLNDDPVVARPPSTVYRFRKFVRKHQWLVGSAATITILLIAGIVGTSYGLIAANRSASRERLAKFDAIDKKEKAEAAQKAEEIAAKRSEEALKVFASSFLSINPYEGAEADMTARDVLNNAQRVMDSSELDDQGKATLLRALTTSFLGIGDFESALTAANKELAIRKSFLGTEHPQTIASLSYLAGAYLESGNYGKALDYFQQVLRYYKQTVGEEHPDTLRTISNLADTYQDMGDYDRARSLFEEVLATRKKTLGADHKDTLKSTQKLADNLQLAGRFREALPMLKTNFEARKTLLGPDHAASLDSMQSLAMLKFKMGDNQAAIDTLREALRLRQNRFGAAHPSTLKTMNNLAAVLQESGNFDEGFDLYERSLKLKTDELGSDHPSTLVAINNLAEAYRKAGKHKKAIPLLKNGLELREIKLGPNHPSTLSSQNNLALAYMNIGELSKAIPMFETTLKTREKILGPDHPQTLVSLNCLASGYRAADRLEEALPLLEKNVRLSTEKLGESHQSTLKAMNNLASGYRAMGRLQKAQVILTDTVEIQTQKLGEDHPDTMGSLNNLAGVYRDLGKYPESLDAYKRLATLITNKLGIDHPNTLIVKSNLADMHMRVGELDQAITLYEEILKLSQNKFGKEHPSTLSEMNGLAGALSQAGRLNEASSLYEKVYETRIRILGPKHSSTLLSANNLALNYRERGRYEESVKLLKRTFEQVKKRFGVDHPSTLITQSNLAVSLSLNGQIKESIELLESVIKLREEKLGRSHPSTLNSMMSLASNYKKQQRFVEAIDLLEEVCKSAVGLPMLPVASKELRDTYIAANQLNEFRTYVDKEIKSAHDNFGEESAGLAQVLIDVAVDQMRVGDAVAAESNCRKAYQIRKQIDPEAWTTQSAYSILGETLLKLERFSEANSILLESQQALVSLAPQIPDGFRREVILGATQRLVDLSIAMEDAERESNWLSELEKLKSKLKDPADNKE